MGAEITRFKIVLFDYCQNKIEKVILQQNFALNAAEAIKASPDNKIEERLLFDTYVVLAEIRVLLGKYKAKQFNAIATGFRGAKNFDDLIKMIQFCTHQENNQRLEKAKQESKGKKVVYYKMLPLRVLLTSKDEDTRLRFVANAVKAQKSPADLVLWVVEDDSMKISWANSAGVIRSHFSDFKQMKKNETFMVPDELVVKLKQPTATVIGAGSVHNSIQKDGVYSYQEVKKAPRTRILSKSELLFSYMKEMQIQSVQTISASDILDGLFVTESYWIDRLASQK